MKKFVKILLVVLVLAAVIGAGIGGYFIWGNSRYIGKDAALNIALADTGLERSQVHDVDVELDHDHGSACYEVDFETADMEYEYEIDAFTGAILHGEGEPEHHGGHRG